MTGMTAMTERFDRWAGYAALAAALAALVYAVAFVVLKNNGLSAVALLAGGILSAVALFGLYDRIRAAGSLATLGLVLGLAGTMGAAVHGAYDLANVLHPGTAVDPNPVDPRGFLTFGVAGLGLLVLSAAAWSIENLPRPLLYLGFALGVVLIVIYLGRLIILDPNNVLVLGPAAVGALLSIAWYGWLGTILLRGR
jgi:hypothetical protein